MSRSFTAASLLAIALLFVGQQASGDDDLPYLATIAIERMPGTTGAFEETIVSTLHVHDGAKVSAALAYVEGLDVVATVGNTIDIAFVDEPTVTGDPEERFLQSSWVVDYDDAAVQNLVGQLRVKLERPATAAELERFVYDHISNKSYSRAFDLASRVAASSEGDCTEHAVLLAALARANGHHARVVFGIVIVDTDDRLGAFGHAWTEIHNGDIWTILDATLPGAAKNVRQHRYLPLALLDNEGPGYFMSMIEAVAAMPARISGVGNPP